MRPAATVLLLLVLSVVPLAAQGVALVGGTVIDGTGGPALPDGVVLVVGDRIRCVGTVTECPVPDGAETVDVSGSFVTPGLVDAHVHFSQTGWIDGRPDGLTAPDLYPYAETSRTLREHPEVFLRSYLCSGVTAVFDVGGHPWTTGLGDRTEDDPTAPHVRAAGPLVTHAARDALKVDDEHYTFLPMGSDAEVESSLAALVDMGAQAVKVWYLRPPADRRDELDALLMRVGEGARAAGLDLIVHATSLREAKMALRAGAVLLVHSVEDRPVDDEFIELLRANDAVYAPTIVVGPNWTRARASMALAERYDPDDPNGCVDPATLAKLDDVDALSRLMPERRRSTRAAFGALEASGQGIPVMEENLRRVHEAGGTVVLATDAGNPLTLHGASVHQELEAMQAAGLDAADLVVAATRNGARVLGRLDDLGTLEAGKIADLLVLGADPSEDVRAFRQLTHVMRAGVLRTQASLAW